MLSQEKKSYGKKVFHEGEEKVPVIIAGTVFFCLVSGGRYSASRTASKDA